MSGKTKTKRIVIRVPSSSSVGAAEPAEAHVQVEGDAPINAEEGRTNEECGGEGAPEQVNSSEQTQLEPDAQVQGYTSEHVPEQNPVEVATEACSSEIDVQVTDTAVSDPQLSIPTENNSQTPEQLALIEPDLSQLKSDWKNPRLKARDVKIMACGGSSRVPFKKKHQVFEARAAHEEDVPKEGLAESCQPSSESVGITGAQTSADVPGEECNDVTRADEEPPCLMEEEAPVNSEVAAEVPVTSVIAEEGPVAGEVAEGVPVTSESVEDTPVTSEVVEGREVLVTSGNVEEAPVNSGVAEEVPLNSEVAEEEAQEPSEVADKETVCADSTSEPQVDEGGTCASSRTEADETVASIEEKLEKIFSNGRQKGIEVEESPADKLSNSDNVEEEGPAQDQDGVAADQSVMSVVEETGDRDAYESIEQVAPNENQTECNVNNEGDDVDTTSVMEVTEKVPDNSKQSDRATSDSQGKKDSQGEKDLSEGKDKSDKETVKADARKKPVKGSSEPKTGKASPESKKPEASKSPSHSSSRKNRSSRDGVEDGRRSSSSRKDQEKPTSPKDSSRRAGSDSPRKGDKVSRHNSHGARDEKASPSKRDEGKKNGEEESERKHRKSHSPSKETASKQPEAAPAKGNAKTKEQPKELRSSKRCLISSVPSKRKQVSAKGEEDEEERPDSEEEKVAAPAVKKAKVGEESATPVAAKRRGRPPKGKAEERKENAPEKAVPEEGAKSLRHSKRTPKPTEKYKDSQSGKSRPEVPAEAESNRTQKRKLSSEDDEEEATRRSSRSSRSAKKRTRASSPPSGRRKQDAKSYRDDDDEEDDVANIAQSLCRVCGTEQQILLSIFGPEGTQLRLEDKIHTHLPIRVSNTNLL